MYVFLAAITFIPSLVAIVGWVKLHPGGASFTESPNFDDQEKLLLTQHYSRIFGTLTFWKNQANKYGRFHTYCLFWVTVSSISIPVVAQFVSNNSNAQLLLTIISIYTAMLLGLSRAFKVENHHKAYRNGESEFYDIYRRFLDRRESFGSDKNDRNGQLNAYFVEVEKLRKIVRNQETDSIPTLEGLEGAGT
jgi:hypothetical protein